MDDLSFQIIAADAVPFAAVPLLAFKLEIANPHAAIRIHSGVLRCQIQIEATRRQYNGEEQARLVDLFGEPERWGTTLKAMLWTHTTVTVPAFVDRVVVDVPVPCSFDFAVAATKYFDGLRVGDVPLNFLFSGTVFYESRDTGLQVAPIPWDKEARYRLPVGVWLNLMEHYYPNSAWLRLRRDTFERLAAYKRQHAIPTWEEALDRILPDERIEVRS